MSTAATAGVEALACGAVGGWLLEAGAPLGVVAGGAGSGAWTALGTGTGTLVAAVRADGLVLAARREGPEIAEALEATAARGGVGGGTLAAAAAVSASTVAGVLGALSALGVPAGAAGERHAPGPAGRRHRALLVVARDGGGAVSCVLVGIGSPEVAVPVRVWPGFAAAPPLDASEGTPQLGVLAAAAEDRLVGRAPDALGTDVAAVLADARAAAMREGDEAERQARLMAVHGDASGAVVRRLVAQLHAARLAADGLRAVAAAPRPAAR